MCNEAKTSADVGSESDSVECSGEIEATTWRNWISSNHEALKNVVQTIAILIAGVWIATVWLYENWAARYLQKPWAKLSLEVVQSGTFENGDRFAVVEITATNISKRLFFNYGNAMTIRAVEFDSPEKDKSDIDAIDEFINEQTNRQRPWVYDLEKTRSEDRVLAYSQFMSQGYTLQPTESFVSLATIPIPPEIEAIDISARLTYGAANSIFSPNSKVSGGLAIDKNFDLAACAKRLKSKRLYKTTCIKDYSDDYYIRSAYAESTYIFLDQEIDDELE